MKRTIAGIASALFVSLALAGCLGGGGGGHGHSLPTAVTDAPDGVSDSGGTANGSVTPNGTATTAWFEWGTDSTFAVCGTTTPVAVGAGDLPVAVSFPFTGLYSGRTYFYRVVASNEAGTARGAIDWFAPDPVDPATIEVNCLADADPAPAGKVTLRRALDLVSPDGAIVFHPFLDGGTIPLRLVGEDHTTLMGEVYASGLFTGYYERDYGKSALYAVKNVTIDAWALPGGITVAWAGTGERARVLAVYGNLNMNNVTISGGFSSAEPTGDSGQPWTLARGGGLAVWGYATLDQCTVSGNRVAGESTASRDRGAYGGGIYSNGLDLADCIVAGNRAEGYGAAGGGIYSVGGADGGVGGIGNDCRLERCAVSGNRVTAQHGYGGGLFTLGGDPDYMADMDLVNCTVAGNLVEDNPALLQVMAWYSRGGGIYMGGGYGLNLTSCTIAANAISGIAATLGGKPNLGGGGVGATIGNAHVVDLMDVKQSVLAGNTINGAPNDLFTGSLIDFNSAGYNLIGKLDFSQVHVPVPIWYCLSRKHYPKEGDVDGVAAGDVLALSSAHRHPTVVSAGADAGRKAVLWYPPAGDALNCVPVAGYGVSSIWADYYAYADSADQFLNSVLEHLRTAYVSELGSDFGLSFGDMSATVFSATPYIWPQQPGNAPWIAFWRDLDAAIAGRLGTAGMGDDFWISFGAAYAGAYPELDIYEWDYGTLVPPAEDQIGNMRAGGYAAAGAVESETPSCFWARW